MTGPCTHLEYHRGTFTTQARQKASLRATETLLRTTEALAAFESAGRSARGPLTAAFLERMKKLLG